MLNKQVCNRHGDKTNRWSLGLSLSVGGLKRRIGARRRAVKTGVFSRISQDILDRFFQSFHRESALDADDRPVACFPICQGTLPWQPNNVVRNEKVMNVD